MSSKSRNNSLSVRRRTATAQDLMQALNRADTRVESKKRGLAFAEETALPPQEPRFLKDIPQLDLVSPPQEPRFLKDIPLLRVASPPQEPRFLDDIPQLRVASPPKKPRFLDDILQLDLVHPSQEPRFLDDILQLDLVPSPQEPRFLKDIPPIGAVYEPKYPATQKLKKIIEENYYSAAFERAIKTVSTQKIPELDRIHTLSQYYYFIDEMVTWIPEVRVWEWDGVAMHERTDYLRITQFYYYFNQDELEVLQSPVAPMKETTLSPISLWLREFAIEWGAFLDTPESTRYLESYKYGPEYTWQDYEKEPQEYKTFNEYFARQFKDIDVQRPVAQVDNDRVIVFPAESTFVGHWTVSTGVGDPLPMPPAIVVKHIEWSIEELLQDTKYKDDFKGGVFCHSFLNTFDYHRQHTPVSGKVLEAKFIPGQVYLEVSLEELSKEEREDENSSIARAIIPQRLLDAGDPTGYQVVQCRGLLVLESPIGKVAVLPMGMAQVSSVVFVTPKSEGQRPILLTPKEKEGRNYHQQVELLNDKVKNALVGKYLSKGEMFSYFQFGGSDCVVVFERKANVNVTASINTHYPIRSQYAISNINELP